MSTIHQWDQASNNYLDSQEASNHAKKEPRNRHEALQ